MVEPLGFGRALNQQVNLITHYISSFLRFQFSCLLVIACSNQSVYSAREGSLIFSIDLRVNSQFPDS